VRPTERFVALVRGDERQLRLDQAALLIAAHAYDRLDIDEELARLDRLAESCYAPTLDALVHHLFVDHNFHGNSDDYYDPRNSFLNEVLERRVGIPITLSVLTMEVGRRLGVPVAGVSMPGHFLLRDRVDPEVFVDPFARGALLDRRGCEARFHAVHGPGAEFDPSFLDPIGPRAILSRMLANLKAVYVHKADRAALTWVLGLRAEIPGVEPGERARLASVLAARGDFGGAADALDRLADEVPGERDRHRASAQRMRARLN
jgi:regulator of sirC expression with transglutaminase-like and TPR domain